MAKFKAIFLQQEPWEADRFQAGVGADMEVVAFQQGSDLLEVGVGHPETVMVIGGSGVTSVKAAELFPLLKMIQTHTLTSTHFLFLEMPKLF